MHLKHFEAEIFHHEFDSISVQLSDSQGNFLLQHLSTLILPAQFLTIHQGETCFNESQGKLSETFG
jgi:hypothetical protein